MPSIAPNHAGPAPIAAKNAGSTAVAVSWLQSPNKLVSPTPRTVRFSHDFCSVDSAIVFEFVTRESFLRGAIQDYSYFFERDQPTFHHLVESWQDFLDAFRELDDLKDDRQILRQSKNLVGVIDARSAVTPDPP